MANNDFDPAAYIGSAIGNPVTITSGYRTPQHNAAVGGVQNSAHLSGEAYDFVPKGGNMRQAANALVQSGIPFDQIINEGDHVHVSFAPTMRRQVLGMQPAAQSGPSDDQILSALTGKGRPTPATGDATTASQGPSDDQILKALTGTGQNKAPVSASQNGSAGKSASAGVSGTLADMVRSVPGGLVKGVSAIAGLPGDFNALLDYAANKVTGNKIATRTLPTSEEIAQHVAAPFGGFYKPQTTAGKYAETVAGFAPAAVAPGNALVRAARVVAPGVASEAAGQATAGTPAEPYARLGGAVLGGLGAGMAENALISKESVPSTTDIRQAASNAYDKAAQAGVVVKGDAMQNLAEDIKHTVADAGIDPTLHPKAVAALNRIASAEGDTSLKGLDILRRVANGAAGSMDKDESRIAHIIVDKLDDFVEGLSPDQLVSGDAQTASDALKEARSLWARQAKSSAIDTLFERAKNRAETVGGSGYENALRVEFRQLAQNAKRMRQFSPAEQDAIRNVARGDFLGNTARTIGKMAPTNLMAMLGEMGMVAFEPKLLAAPILGAAGRAAAERMTLGKANAASELIRRGAPAAQAATEMGPQAVLNAVLAQKNAKERQSNMLVPAYAQ